MDKEKKLPPPLPKIDKPKAVAPMPLPRQVPGAGPSLPAVPRQEPAQVPKEQILEKQVQELQKQLLEQKEKILLSTVKAKEEEMMATKVEESIKDVQEKLRKERFLQELQDNLNKASERVRDLEQQVIQERETWVQTLKAQLSQRDIQEKDIEQTFQARIHDLERKWQDEKNRWINTVHSREEEVSKLKTQAAFKEDELNRNWERKFEVLESEKSRLSDENKLTRAAYEEKEKEALASRNQLAFLTAQVRQEKEKIERYHGLLEKQREENESLVHKLDTREKEYYLLKTQASLLSAKNKSESERLLKEIDSHKEYINQLKVQQEMNLRSKDEELKFNKQAFEIKENELRGSLAKKDEEIKDMKTSYETRLREKEAELTNIQSREKDLLRDLGDLHVKQAQYETQLNGLNEIKNQREKELESAKQQLKEKEYQVESISRQAEQERARHEVDSNKVKNEIEYLKIESNRLTQHNSDMENRLKEKEQLLGNITRQAEQEKASHEVDSNKAKNEIEQLKIESNRLAQHNSDMGNQLRELQRLCDERTRELENIKESEKEHLKNLADSGMKLSQYESIVAGLNEKIGLRDTEIEKNKVMLREKDSTLEQALRQQEQAKKEHEIKISRFENEIDTMRLEAEKREKDNNEQLRVIREAEIKRSESEEKIRNLLHAAAEKENIITRNQAETERVKEILGAREQQITELKKQMENIDETVKARFTGEYESMMNRISHLESHNKELQGRLVERDSMINELIEKQDDIKRRYSDQLGSVESQWKKEKKELQFAVSLRDSDLAELTEQVNRLMREKRHMAESKEDETRIMEKRVTDILKNKGEISKQLAEFENEASRKERIIESQREEIRALSEKAGQLKADYENRIQQQTRDLNKEWEKKVHEAMENIGDIEIELRKKEKDYNHEIDKNRAEFEDRIAGKQSEYQTQLASFKKESEELKKELEKIRAEYEDRINEKEKEIEKVDGNWKQFHSQISEENEILQKKLLKYEEEVKSLQAQLNSTREAEVVPDNAVEKSIAPVAENKGSRGSLGIIKVFFGWLNKPVFRS